jgi:hypothetical protein
MTPGDHGFASVVFEPLCHALLSFEASGCHRRMEDCLELSSLECRPSLCALVQAG